MTGPFIELIIWTTTQVFEPIMKIFPKPLTADPGALERYHIAESYFSIMASRANRTSYRIARTLMYSYVHAPLCPLPAELPYLVPKMTWQCLAMVYRQVRMIWAKRQNIEDIPEPRIVDGWMIYDEPIFPNLREHMADLEAIDVLMAEDFNEMMAHRRDNVDVRDNIMVNEVDNIMDDEEDMLPAPQHFHLGPGR